MLQKLTLPPGLYMRGTDYSRANRWADSNLVRWADGSARVVGGWEPFIVGGTPMAPVIANEATEAPRGLFVWSDNSAVRNIAIGTNSKVYVVGSANSLSDITPIGFVGVNKEAVIEQGFGIGLYGAASYGTPRLTDSPTVLSVSTWKFDQWGQDLLAGVRNSGEVIHAWSPGDAALAPIGASPSNYSDFCVTDERIVLAVGCGTAKNEVVWSDQEDRTLWAPASTNQAGSVLLPNIGPHVAVVRMLGELLIIGRTGAYVGRYIGPPLVYGFERISHMCGGFSANAVAVYANTAIWPCGRTFWLYNGAVAPLESEVIDFFYNDVNVQFADKTTAYTLRDFHEFSWLYVSKTSPDSEVDSYITYNIKENAWYKGKMRRSYGVDRGVTNEVVMLSRNGVLYNHELASVAISDGPEPYVETGPLELGGVGEAYAHVSRIIPDFTIGDVTNISLVIRGRAMPNTSEYSHGPYQVRNPTNVRACGRSLRLRFSSRSVGWMIGDIRAEFAQGGKR